MGQERLLQAMEQAWQLRLTLAAPALNAAAVQWAVFSEDPKIRFATDLEMMAPHHQARLAESVDAAGRIAVRLRQLAATWDHLFRLVRGDRVWLLTPGPLECTCTSNEAGGRKWAATKAVRGAAVAHCWCVPFDAMPGRQAAIVFDDQNVVDLADLAGTPAGA